MRTVVADLLNTKGRDVVTVHPDDTIMEAAKVLLRHRIGVVVVVDRRQCLAGILSERDVVRAFATEGEEAGTASVRSYMTA